MRKSLRAVGYMTASLSLASAALAAPAPNGWKSQVETDEPPQAVVKLNPTGRTYEIQVPLKVDGARLGDVGIKITADDKLSVDAKLLKTYLGKIYRSEVLTAALAIPEEQTVQVAGGSVVSKKAPGTPSSDVQLVAQQLETKETGELLGEKPSYLSVATLKDRGITMRYDPLNLELEVFPTVDQRPTSAINFKQSAEEESATLEQPAYVSAYLNMHLGASYMGQSAYGSTGVEAPTIDFDGAIRIGPYVLEAEGTFYSLGSRLFSPSYFQDYVFYRRGTRLVYDLPDEAIRVRVGDVSPDYTGFQTAPDLLGISADVAYAQLQPQKSIRPTGAHSFPYRAAIECRHSCQQRPDEAHQTRPRKLQFDRSSAEPRREQREAHHRRRYRPASDPGVYWFFRAGVAGARDQRMVGQRRYQVLRHGRRRVGLFPGDFQSDHYDAC